MVNELEFICTSPRWEILELISKNKNTATEIAKHLNFSVAHINQQLKLLEAYNYIKKSKKSKGTVGKPRTKYHITKNHYFIGKLTRNQAKITIVRPNKKSDFINNTMFIMDEEQKYFLQKFYFTHEEFIHTTDLIATLPPENQIHLLVIAKKVDEIRSKKSNFTIGSQDGKQMKFVLWSHTKEEIIKGLENKEKYFIEKISEAKPLWNLTDEDILSELKEVLNRCV